MSGFAITGMKGNANAAGRQVDTLLGNVDKTKALEVLKGIQTELQAHTGTLKILHTSDGKKDLKFKSGMNFMWITRRDSKMALTAQFVRELAEKACGGLPEERQQAAKVHLEIYLKTNKNRIKSVDELIRLITAPPEEQGAREPLIRQQSELPDPNPHAQPQAPEHESLSSLANPVDELLSGSRASGSLFEQASSRPLSGDSIQSQALPESPPDGQHGLLPAAQQRPSLSQASLSSHGSFVSQRGDRLSGGLSLSSFVSSDLRSPERSVVHRGSEHEDEFYQGGRVSVDIKAQRDFEKEIGIQVIATAMDERLDYKSREIDDFCSDFDEYKTGVDLALNQQNELVDGYKGLDRENLRSRASSRQQLGELHENLTQWRDPSISGLGAMRAKWGEAIDALGKELKLAKEKLGNDSKQDVEINNLISSLKNLQTESAVLQEKIDGNLRVPDYAEIQHEETAEVIAYGSTTGDELKDGAIAISKSIARDMQAQMGILNNPNQLGAADSLAAIHSNLKNIQIDIENYVKRSLDMAQELRNELEIYIPAENPTPDQNQIIALTGLLKTLDEISIQYDELRDSIVAKPLPDVAEAVVADVAPRTQPANDRLGDVLNQQMPAEFLEATAFLEDLLKILESPKLVVSEPQKQAVTKLWTAYLELAVDKREVLGQQDQEENFVFDRAKTAWASELAGAKNNLTIAEEDLNDKLIPELKQGHIKLSADLVIANAATTDDSALRKIIEARIDAEDWNAIKDLGDEFEPKEAFQLMFIAPAQTELDQLANKIEDKEKSVKALKLALELLSSDEPKPPPTSEEKNAEELRKVDFMVQDLTKRFQAQRIGNI